MLNGAFALKLDSRNRRRDEPISSELPFCFGSSPCVTFVPIGDLWICYSIMVRNVSSPAEEVCSDQSGRAPQRRRADAIGKRVASTELDDQRFLVDRQHRRVHGTFGPMGNPQGVCASAIWLPSWDRSCSVRSTPD